MYHSLSSFPVRNPILHTARCTLRCISIADEEHVWTASRHPGFTDGMLWNPPETKEEMRPFTEKAISDWANDIRYCWTIEGRDDHRFIGRIEIRRLEEKDHEVYDLGFWVHPNEWGKGYMTEAALEVLRFGFEDLGTQKILSGYAPWNTASKKVHEKIGMRNIGYFENYTTKNGKPFPEERYELTRAEWKKAQK